MENQSIIIMVLRLLGSLALLVFGMKTMSDSLQKMAGPQLRHILGRMTTNRFTGMLTGVLVTAAVQSSTATTVMTVSFVNAELLSLAQAISVIMGANIGTTLTAWIMTVGVAFKISDFVWPVFVIALLLIYRKKHENVGGFLFGLAFLLLGLGTLRDTGEAMKLGEQPAILNFFQAFDPSSFSTTLIFLLIGSILTMCVQSSAAVMAITMILCSSGALPIYQGIALVMGENIGTTVTSNLAAMTASTQARRTALSHMFFNLFGVCWILIILHPFIDWVCSLVGYDTTMVKDVVGNEAFLANAAKLSVVLATFHTCFNVANTFILIWFIPQIEKIVCAVIKGKKKAENEEDEPLKLKYIGAGLMKTPEIAVLQAQKEITHFATRMHRMFGMVRELLEEHDDEKFGKLFERIRKYEDISDNMEIEIAKYLDACYNLGRSINRLHESGKDFPEHLKDEIHKMMEVTDKSLVQMDNVMNSRREDVNLDDTLRIEIEINSMRDELKKENITSVNEHQYDYAMGTMFTDIVSECEKLGDYVVNVVEARLGK